MAEDRKDPPATGKGSASPQQAIPNRDRKREAPVIDMKPTEVVEVKPADTAKAEAATPGQGKAVDAKPADVKPADVKPAEATPASSPKSEAARPGAAAPDAIKSEVARGETPKTETGKAEAVKLDAGKIETEKSETASAATAAAKPAEAPTFARPADPAAFAPKPDEPAKTQRGGAGLISLLLAGVAGGAIALGGGYALVSGQISQRIETIVASSTSKAAGDIMAGAAAGERKQQGEIDKQSAAIAALGKQVADSGAQTRKLEAELAALREQAAKPAAVAAPAAKVDLGPIEAGLGELEKRIAAIETALSAPKTPVRATDPSDPDVKPPSASAPALATPAPSVAAIVPPALLAEVAAIAQRLKAIESRPQTPPADLSPLQTRLLDIEKRLAPLAEKLAPLEQKIAPLVAATTQNRDALGSQTKDIAQGRARADAAALAVVSRSLADAVASGAPFVNLLKAAQALGGDADAVKRLAAMADKGVQTSASLAAQFGPLAAQMIESENKPSPNASLTEKLTASASRLVRVRPADDTTEETTPALSARIGAALRAGKSAEALALFDKLPQAARSMAASWAGALRARIDADDAVQKILNAALARLSQP